MTSEEQELLEKYLSHLNVLGEEGTHPTSTPGTWKCATPAAPAAPRTLQEASELRFKDVLDAARVFKHQQDTNSN